MFCDGKGSLLRALGVHVLATFATLHPLLPGVGVLLVGVQVDPLGEALEADEAEVRLLPAVDQLVPLKFRRGGEPLVTKLTGVLFLKLFFQQGQLLQIGGRGLGHELAGSCLFCLFLAFLIPFFDLDLTTSKVGRHWSWLRRRRRRRKSSLSSAQCWAWADQGGSF